MKEIPRTKQKQRKKQRSRTYGEATWYESWTPSYLRLPNLDFYVWNYKDAKLDEPFFQHCIPDKLNIEKYRSKGKNYRGFPDFMRWPKLDFWDWNLNQ